MPSDNKPLDIKWLIKEKLNTDKVFGIIFSLY